MGKIYGWLTSAAAAAAAGAQTVLYHMGPPYGGGPALHVHTHTCLYFEGEAVT